MRSDGNLTLLFSNDYVSFDIMQDVFGLWILAWLCATGAIMVFGGMYLSSDDAWRDLLVIAFSRGT